MMILRSHFSFVYHSERSEESPFDCSPKAGRS